MKSFFFFLILFKTTFELFIPLTLQPAVLTVISSTRTCGARHTSDLEMKYLMGLIMKHGVENIEGMAKDRKLNPGQKTAGELGRAIRKAGLKG